LRRAGCRSPGVRCTAPTPLRRIVDGHDQVLFDARRMSGAAGKGHPDIPGRKVRDDRPCNSPRRARRKLPHPSAETSKQDRQCHAEGGRLSHASVFAGRHREVCPDAIAARMPLAFVELSDYRGMRWAECRTSADARRDKLPRARGWRRVALCRVLRLRAPRAFDLLRLARFHL
jgi:hypothetical protein